MPEPISEIIGAYRPDVGLENACTIPSAWYTDRAVAALERDTVFSRSWLVVAREDQLASPGRFVTSDVAGEPTLLVRDREGVLRAFYNVCRHHAAAVMTAPEGTAAALRCPYHGWTYSLDGRLKGMPEFDGVCGFDKSQNGLVPITVDAWEGFVFVRLDADGPDLRTFMGDLAPRVAKLDLASLRFFDRRTYEVRCNWKVFIDNYLDGGYHVPHAHKSLNSVLDYANYRIECVERFCEQSSPLVSGGDAQTAAVRRGDRAFYYWLYPNFMLNWYEGVMDTNLAWPLDIDRTLVVFDFYFADDSPAARDDNVRSIAVADRVQQEDVSVCESVQRGLRSRAYDVGRLSVRREAGEQQFHRLLHQDLSAGLRS